MCVLENFRLWKRKWTVPWVVLFIAKLGVNLLHSSVTPNWRAVVFSFSGFVTCGIWIDFCWALGLEIRHKMLNAWTFVRGKVPWLSSGSILWDALEAATGRKGWMESWMGEELRLASFTPCLHSEMLTYICFLYMTESLYNFFWIKCFTADRIMKRTGLDYI